MRRNDIQKMNEIHRRQSKKLEKQNRINLMHFHHEIRIGQNGEWIRKRFLPLKKQQFE